MQAHVSLIGKKRGMTHIFDENGDIVPCSVISIESNVVTQVKTKETDGYSAIQLGADEIVTKDPRTITKRVSKAKLGHLQKAGSRVFRKLSEVRLDDAAVEGFALGQELNIDLLSSVSFVDIIGISKGKGFQGVMKKYGFRGGPASHGSGFHRHAGSIGMRSTPGRCFPGSKRPSHMGCDRVTVKNLSVVKVDLERKVLLVKGAVPGFKGGLVMIKSSSKGMK